jgi:two-component system, response regulator PdtaR
MSIWDAISSAMASHEEATPQRAVLVVEDEILIRSAAAEFLRGAGYKVIEAATAVEAVAVFASRVQIDLVFSDINMPGSTDGVGLARWVTDHHPGVHVILTSAISHARRAGEVRAAGFLPKPYRLAEVARRIGSLLSDPPREDA